jgi:hypothetical protein
MDNQNSNNKYHIHNVMNKDNQIIESSFKYKKVYIYISSSINKISNIVSDDISHKLKLKLTCIGSMCGYCGPESMVTNETYRKYKQHLRDQA